MADQQFCLRWNEHTGTMVKVFKQMLDSQSFVDCTLACEGKLIKAHKMILAACSPYLHTILEENTSKHPIIFLPHLKYSDIRALVDYMYCGEVYISFGHLPSLLKAAEVLRIKGLTDVTNGGGGGGGSASGALSNGSSSSSNNNNNNNNTTGPHNISSSSDHHHHISSGDTSGTSSASNLMLEQALGGAGGPASGTPGPNANEQTQLSGAAHNLGQLLGNNLSNLLGAAANNNNNINNINNNHHHHHLLDRDRESANGDCGDSESGNNNIIKNTSAASMLDQSFEDEENEYDINSHMTLDPEVSFADDCSNEDANNEDESTNGESHSKSSFTCSPVPSDTSTSTTYATSPHHQQSFSPTQPHHHSFLSSAPEQQALAGFISSSPSPVNNHHHHHNHPNWLSDHADNSNNPLTNTPPYHQSSTDKTFLCHLCRCSFTAQSSLRRHMHRHYTDRERFECEICHNSYSRKDYLKEHKKTKHQIST